MSNQLQTLTSKLALTLGMDSNAGLVETLKATAFKGQVTDAQMTALLIVANQYGLNPWTKEIYAFPDKGGIVPVVGLDGWSRIINSNSQFDGMDFEQDAESCTCIIYRKDRNHPVRVTEWLSECIRVPQQGKGPWQSHPKRMLRHKAMIQCARLAFGFVGIYEQDEAERILDSTIADIRQTRSPANAAASNAPDGLEAFEADHLEGMRDAAMMGVDALQAAFMSIHAGAAKTAFWAKHGPELKKAASEAMIIDAETGEVA